ncbi:MAG TPA: hypothetical protein DEA22_15375 [Blastocatellia bacterium]|nr:hypothetical protein [Blastocatellia bacterium]
MNEIDPGVLAEQIARLIAAERQNKDLTPLIASIEKINSRLDVIENALPLRQSFAVSPNSHPSLERFVICEAADQSQEAKTCGFEPHNRPCDHCSMCGSRGF